MRAFRVVWAVVAVLGFAAALFVPVAALPVLGFVAVLARWHSRKKLAARQGRFGSGAAVGPLVVLAAAVALAELGWCFGDDDWNLFGPYESWDPSPNPLPSRWWTHSAIEHLAFRDPYYAGVTLPALIFAVPAALVVAVLLALRK